MVFSAGTYQNQTPSSKGIGNCYLKRVHANPEQVPAALLLEGLSRQQSRTQRAQTLLRGARDRRRGQAVTWEALAGDSEARISRRAAKIGNGTERTWDLHAQRHPRLPGLEQSSLTRLSWPWAEVGPETAEVPTNLNSSVQRPCGSAAG